MKERTIKSFGLVTAFELANEILDIFRESLSKYTIAKHRTKLGKELFNNNLII
jgi:hypothetical protein